MPGRKWYVIALAVLVLGAVVAGVFVFSRIHGLRSGVQQVVVPGEAELVFDAPGTYTIYHERTSVVDGRVFSSSDVSGMQVELFSVVTGEPVELRTPQASSSYSLGGREGVSIFDFDVDRPGRYRLVTLSPQGRGADRAVFAVGRGFVGKILMTAVIAVVIAFAAFLLAVTIATVTFLRRRRAGRATASGSEQPALPPLR
jgi:hypothetical protein